MLKKFSVLLTLLLLFTVGASAQFSSTTNMSMKKPNPGLTTGWDVYLNGNFDQLDSYLGGVATLTQNSATPSVSGIQDAKTNNNTPTTYTNFTNGWSGQNITIICNDTNTTILSNSTISVVSPFYCTTVGNGKTITLSLNGTVWTETSRTQSILFPDVKVIPAANCNGTVSTTVAGAGWDIGTGGTATCRQGTNNLGGYISITSTSSTFGSFFIEIPEDQDFTTPSNPYIRVLFSSADATNGHTVIPQIQVACYKGDGSTTDDVAPNAAHALSTVSLNGNANRFWSTSNVQMNSTDLTGCVAGALMRVTVGRSTDTATDAKFYAAVITWQRILTVQAN